MKIRKGYKGGIELDVRVLLLGETGSGKTSLLGVLNTGETDDGKVEINFIEGSSKNEISQEP